MNTNFLNSLTNFLKKRTFEFIGLILISTSIGLAIAFTTYSPEDPSFVYGNREFEIKNFFGIYGSSIADFLLQSFGLVSFLILANFLFWGINLIIQKEIKRIILNMGVSILLGTYKVRPPNPCCLWTDLVRGLCFISTRPELTRIRGGKGGKIVKIG